MVTGVKSFVMGNWLCVVLDWSKRGIGYVLWQKRCGCTNIRPECCQEGWVVVAVGSRFCTAAETGYAPVEGEMLAFQWVLHKTSHYKLGCQQLMALTDRAGSATGFRQNRESEAGFACREDDALEFLH